MQQKVRSTHIKGSTWIVLLLILIATAFASFTRILRLDELPFELHRDEAAIGYNAYSILKTGLDEHGQGPFPLVYTSFGDFKLPGLLYLTAASINFFGFSVFAVRLPTAILAVALVPLSAVLAMELFKDKAIAATTSIMVSTSLWHTFLARTAYEPIGALTLHVAALVCLLKTRQSQWYFLLAALFFLLSFLTYNVPLLLFPFVVLGYIATYIRQQNYGKKIFWIGIFLLFAVAFIAVALSRTATAGKQNATIFTNTEAAVWVKTQQDSLFLLGLPHRVRQTVVNLPYTHMIRFVRGYVAAYNPEFLFFTGGVNPWHNLLELQLGNMYPVLIFPLLTAIVVLCRKLPKLTSGEWLLLGYLIISPIPDAVTIDAPVTNRLLDFHFALLLLSAYGFVAMLRLSRRFFIGKLFVAFLVLIYCYSVTLFLSRYFLLENQRLEVEWAPGTRQLFTYLEQYKGVYDRIYISGKPRGGLQEISTPYIFAAFFTKHNPHDLQQFGEWTKGNSLFNAYSMPPFYFRDIPEPHNWTATDWQEYLPGSIQTVLVVYRTDKPQEIKTRDAMFTLAVPHSDVILYAYEVTKPE